MPFKSIKEFDFRFELRFETEVAQVSGVVYKKSGKLNKVLFRKYLHF